MMWVIILLIKLLRNLFSPKVIVICNDSQFRNIIVDTINHLSNSVKHHLRNTIVVLSDGPSQNGNIPVLNGSTLMGIHKPLYFGIDKIELYKSSILLFAKKPGNSVRQCVERTLLHEIGHHFGFDHKKLSSLGL